VIEAPDPHGVVSPPTPDIYKVIEINLTLLWIGCSVIHQYAISTICFLGFDFLTYILDHHTLGYKQYFGSVVWALGPHME
jgi:hypothetical protein